MTRGNKESIDALNRLIETCKDGEKGFRTAAEAVKNAEMKALFQGYSEQRKHFASELQQDVRRMGASPEFTGTVAAALHRGWINLKGLMAGMDDAAILSECESGEEVARKAYEEALQKPLPEDSRALVQRQLRQIQEAFERVRSLELAHQTH